MINTEQIEKTKEMYFKEGLGYKRIAKALGISRDTVRATICRYKKRFGTSVLQEEGYTGKIPTRKPREKKPKNIAEERIAKLEMQVDLLKNFILEIERR